ncbi:MAG: FecR domain-containing protein [Nitrospiraceae bacterium]|nr:FecR domain-containing protein [Nitrospiraceae bacterium]MDA8089606.1 FecR domain-containing protein [Nitrospiraceae bacterium]
MKKHGGFLDTVVVFFMLFFFSAAQAAYSQAQLDIVGQVQGNGSAQMKTFSGKWIGVSDKIYPVAGGSVLRTRKGGMTITFKNGARIELGSNSQVAVGGAGGNYSVSVQRGTMAYDVPQAARLSINTVNSKMTADPFSKGFVGQGKKTYIKSIAGSLAVYDPNGLNPVFMRTGQTVLVSHGGEAYSINPSALDESSIEAAISKDPAPGGSSGGGSTILLIAGGVAAAAGVGVALGSGGGGGGGGGNGDPNVSPSQP